MTNVYTIDEVARHNNAKNLWIVIHDAIYDVTTFHKEHPGGEEVLLKLAGQDATECFENVGHSQEAIHLRENFKIGELVDNVNSRTSKTTNAEEEPLKEPIDDWDYPEPKKIDNMQSWNLMFICTAIVIYAIILFYWFRM